ncbi:hypothetical protein JVU11DRAFT_2338 [Chiua virens]|nr:hypothetical protein JVU11DRAFT_2338 [Chiua virens]
MLLESRHLSEPRQSTFHSNPNPSTSSQQVKVKEQTLYHQRCRRRPRRVLRGSIFPHAPALATSTATDTGLAEWTNRIKAMQRQVDADDEAEQRCLEEEIMRARLARMRRSRTGQSGDFGVGMHGIDLSTRILVLTAWAAAKELQESPSHVEGDLGTSSSEKPSVSGVSLRKPALKSPLNGVKQAPISLAAFMGGNATGPRLKRHEPQVDANVAYDGRVDHGPVHPIFGRGGVAMPGMVGRDVAAAPPSPTPSASTSVSQFPLPSPATQSASEEPLRARTMSISNVARKYVEKIEEQATSPSSFPKPSGLAIRERRQSTPHGTSSELKVIPTPSFPFRPLSQNLGRRAYLASEELNDGITFYALSKDIDRFRRIAEAHSELPTKTIVDEPRAKTPGTDVTRAKTPIQSSPTRTSFPGAAPWQTPRHQPSPQLPSTSAIPSKSPGPPSPFRGTLAPQPQRGASPGFLRPPGNSSLKDPTPSISRLQGRGFVQSIVQASDRISGDPQASPSAAPKHVFPSTSPAPSHGGSEVREQGARRASVLDRWTPVMNGSGSGAATPPKSATPMRSHTAHVRTKSGQGTGHLDWSRRTTQGHSVRSSVSLPAIPKTPSKKSDGFPAQGSQESLGSSKSPVKINPPSSSAAGKVTDRWTEPTLIGIKSTSGSSSHSRANRPSSSAKPVGGAAGMVGRRALPGLANPTTVVAAGKDGKQTGKDKEECTTVPPSPTRHTRIPSTGNRALVMEVAQALTEAAQQQDKEKEKDEKEKDKVIAGGASLAARGSTATCQVPSTGLGGLPGEKRKSSYERYSAIAMPPLAEERTPAVTPAHTMSRNVGQSVISDRIIDESPLSSLRVEAAGDNEQRPSSVSSKVHIDHVEEPLPSVDVAALLQMERRAEFVPNPDLRTVSVEVIMFYDAEVLVIVNRAKSRESGLVTTQVWCWKGKRCRFGEKEEKKVGELARRYGTSADMVDQQREPAELVHTLGGRLAIRQGTRAHWSSENTTMHIVRSSEGHILIDEIDLSIRNLCSGYSYCITILDNIYVWHGCGSVSAERDAALRYAQGMAATGTLVKELVEGENDGDDEMFWMIIGEAESYAKADYWRWRSSVVPPEPRCWIVDVANLDTPIRPILAACAEMVQQGSVYIIDCFWEFFVLVGKDARAKRSDITLAINTAMEMAPLVAASKPFSPTVHVLILPTQLPLDMRLAFRNLDEMALNGGFIPDHMNILSTPEALEHVGRAFTR